MRHGNVTSACALPEEMRNRFNDRVSAAVLSPCSWGPRLRMHHETIQPWKAKRAIGVTLDPLQTPHINPGKPFGNATQCAACFPPNVPLTHTQCRARVRVHIATNEKVTKRMCRLEIQDDRPRAGGRLAPTYPASGA